MIKNNALRVCGGKCMHLNTEIGDSIRSLWPVS